MSSREGFVVEQEAKRLLYEPHVSKVEEWLPYASAYVEHMQGKTIDQMTTVGKLGLDVIVPFDHLGALVTTTLLNAENALLANGFDVHLADSVIVARELFCPVTILRANKGEHRLELFVPLSKAGWWRARNFGWRFGLHGGYRVPTEHFSDVVEALEERGFYLMTDTFIDGRKHAYLAHQQLCGRIELISESKEP